MTALVAKTWPHPACVAFVPARLLRTRVLRLARGGLGRVVGARVRASIARRQTHALHVTLVAHAPVKPNERSEKKVSDWMDERVQVDGFGIRLCRMIDRINDDAMSVDTLVRSCNDATMHA